MHKHEKLLNLLNLHLKLYNSITAKDIYKLLYQGTMGPRHMLQNIEKAHNYLLQEWQRVPENIKAPLLVPVSLDHSVVRINFQRAKADNINVDNIWQMKYQSALHFVEKKKTFKTLWWKSMELVKNGLVPLEYDDFYTLDQLAWKDNFPPMHHSAGYRDANYPAYRIILQSEYDKYIQNIEETHE